MNKFSSRLVSLTLCLVIGSASALCQLSLLPGDNQISPTAGTKTSPAIAHGNGVSLVVWSDSRANRYGSFDYETSADIYGVRLDENGTPIDPVAFPIAALKAAQTRPQVCWNGTNFLVVFQSVTLNGTGYYYQDCLLAVRVSPDGEVLDQQPITLTGFVPSGYGFTVASDGTNWIVCNQGTSTSNSVFALRIAPDGTVLDPPTRKMVQETYYMRSNFRLAYANGVFLLTFNDRYNNGSYTTGFVRFDSNLRLLDPTVRTLHGSELAGLDSFGETLYAIWINPTYPNNIFGSRVSVAGTKLDGAGVNISVGNTPSAYSPIGVKWDGNNWRIFWGTGATNRFAKVSFEGTLLTPGGVAVSGMTTGEAAGAENGVVRFAAINPVAANVVTTSFINDANQTSGDQLVSNSLPSQTRTDIAAGDDGFMLVYKSESGSSVRVLAQPLSVLGSPLTLQPIELGAASGSTFPGAPSVAYANGKYFVSWGTSPGVVGRRILQDGTLLEASPVMLMPQAFGPTEAAANGDTFLVVARKVGSYHESINAVGMRVRASDGALLDGSALVLGGWYVSRPPAVVAISDKFLAVYHSNVSHDNPSATTMGVFVPTTGAPGAEFAIHGPFSTAGGNGIFELGLASNGTVALMVQSQELSSGVETDLLIRFIDANGNVSAYRNLTPWDGNQYRPRAAWDGTQFVIVYQEQKNRETFWTLDQIDARSDLFGMRVLSNGAVVDPQGFAISTGNFAETDPTVTCRFGSTMFAGSLMRVDDPYQNYRVHRSFVSAGNNYPVAVINPSVTGGAIPLTVNFTSTGSSDSDGAIVAYRWDFGDGTTSTQAHPSHTYTVPGPFLATLTVTDNSGFSTTQAVKIRAKLPNKAPIAVARAVPPKGMAPMDVVFYADQSYDPDGFIGNIRWTFSDGGEYWGSIAYHSYPTPGNYTVTMTVWDNDGAQTSTTIPIGVLTASKTAIRR